MTDKKYIITVKFDQFEPDMFVVSEEVKDQIKESFENAIGDSIFETLRGETIIINRNVVKYVGIQEVSDDLLTEIKSQEEAVAQKRIADGVAQQSGAPIGAMPTALFKGGIFSILKHGRLINI